MPLAGGVVEGEGEHRLGFAGRGDKALVFRARRAVRRGDVDAVDVRGIGGDRQRDLPAGRVKRVRVRNGGASGLSDST